MNEQIIESYNISDSVWGTIIRNTTGGVFISLDNGITAYSYPGAYREGCRVLCKIIRKPHELRDAVVRIDSVDYDSIDGLVYNYADMKKEVTAA